MQDNSKVNIKFYLNPYKNLITKQEEKANKKPKVMSHKAYLITTSKIPEFYFISFITYEEARERTNKMRVKKLSYGYEKLAIAECVKYIADSTGLKDTSNGIFFSLRRKRANNIDKYFNEKKAPVYELMELGVHFRCKNCGKGNLGLDEYQEKKCFIIEGEGEYNYFTKGIVFCEDCYNNLYK